MTRDIRHSVPDREADRLVGSVFNQSLSRRTFLRRGAGTLAGAGVGGSLLAACGGDDEKSGDGSLVIGAYTDPNVDLIKAKIGPQFTKQTGIKLKWLTVPYENWFDKAFTAALNRTGAYDLMILDDPWIPQFASERAIMKMSDVGLKADPDMVPSLLDVASWPPRKGPAPPDVKGKPELFAMPFVADCLALVYRTDIFGDAPPQTWDDLVRIAKQRQDPANKKYGWVSPAAPPTDPPGLYFSSILYTFGGEYFNEQWEPAFNQQPGLDTLELQLQMFAEIAPPGASTYTYDQMNRSIQRGDSYSGLLYGGFIKAVYDPKLSTVADKLATAVSPKQVAHASDLGSYMAGIPEGSGNPDGAAQFLKFYTSLETQTQFARLGGVPVLRSAFEDDQALSVSPWLPEFGKALEVARQRPRDTEQSQVSAELGKQLSKAYIEKGAKGAQTYLDAAAEKVRGILDRAGYYG